MYYPFSRDYIKMALKELRGKKKKCPIEWETLKLSSDINGREGTLQEAVYTFQTKDGKQYELDVEGYCGRGYCHRKIFRPCAITAIKEKAS